jgi:hypothetical protein
MPVTVQTIDEARSRINPNNTRKFSDEQILSAISEESTDFADKIQQAQNLVEKPTSTQILDELRNSFSPEGLGTSLESPTPQAPQVPVAGPEPEPPAQDPNLIENVPFHGMLPKRPIGATGSFVEDLPGERTVRNFVSGAAGTIGSMLSSFDWLADSDTARTLAKRFRTFAREQAPADPDFTDQLVIALGSSAIFFVPGIGIAKGTAKLAGLAPRLANALGVGVSTALESATEAGGVYQNVLDSTGDKDKASRAATATLLANAPLIAVTNSLGIFSESGGSIRRAVVSSALEATQEAGQEIIGALAEGRPVERKEVVTAGAIGGIIGSGLGGIGGAEEQIQNNRPPIYVAQEETVNVNPEKPPTTQEFNEYALGTEPSSGYNPASFKTEKSNLTVNPDEITKRSTIVKNLDKAFAPIRIGKFRSRKASGIFKTTPEVIRTKKANDIDVISHEVGHAIHKQYFSAPNTKILTGNAFAQWKNELDPMAYEGARDNTVEGFAEFVRLYVTNPQEAEKQAPRFFSQFDNTLARDMPEIRDVLHKARDDFERWVNQSSIAKIKAQISIDEDKTPSNFTFDRLYTDYVDKFHPLNEAVKEITKGNPDLEGADLYKLARLYQGVHGKIDTFLTYKPFKHDNFRFQGKGLKEILRPFNKKKDLENLRVYLVARRALELSRRGKSSGISRADAEQAIKELDTSELRQAAKDLDDYQTATLTYLKDSGVLSNKTFVKIKQLNKSYIPFYRDFSEQKPGLDQKGFTDLFNPVKRLTKKGSDREIIDPLESVIENTYAHIKKAEQNHVGLELLKLSQQDKSGRFVERLPTPLKPIPISNEEIYSIFNKYGNWKETTTFKQLEQSFTKETGIKDGTLSKPLQKLEQIVRESLMNRGMTEGEASVFVEKLKGAKSDKERNILVEKVIEKQSILHTFKELELDLPEVINVFRPTSYSKSENIVTVFKNGKPISLKLDPELYKAMTQLERQDVSLFTKILAFPARTLRAGATALSPEFTARNPLRDQFTAFVFSEFGFIPGLDFTRGLFHMLGRTETFQRFKQSGAENSMLVSMDRDYLQKNLRDLTRTLPASNKILNPLELLRTLSEWSEMATRVGEFNRGLKELGVNERRAIETVGLSAREVGLDFARMGAQTRSMNQITAFQNAAIQGLDKPVRAFKDHPGRTMGRIIAGITLPSILLWFVNQDEEDIQELPQWQRDLFWVFKPPKIAARLADIDPNIIIRIPKPFEMGILFGSFPERILDWMKTNDPEGIKKISKTFIEGAVPPLIPTAAIPLIDNYANRSTFLGRPIVPRNRENLAPPFQHTPYTSELSKILGRQLNYSPAKIDNIFRGWFAGAGRLGIEAIDGFLKEFNIVDLPTAPDPTLADTPVVRAFIARSPSGNTESIRSFYAIYEKHKGFMDTANFLMRNSRNREGFDWLTENKELLLPDKELSLLETTANKLNGFRDEIEEINASKNLDPSIKRQRIDGIYRAMSRTAKDVVTRFKKKNK